jgi:hypothetical protein
MTTSFHFEIPESERRDLADTLAASAADGTPRIRASCRWWRSWCERDAGVLVVEGELYADADAAVLRPFAHSEERGRLQVRPPNPRGTERIGAPRGQRPRMEGRERRTGANASVFCRQ